MNTNVSRKISCSALLYGLSLTLALTVGCADENNNGILDKDSEELSEDGSQTDTYSDTGAQPDQVNTDSGQPDDMTHVDVTESDISEADTSQPEPTCDRYNTLGSFVVQASPFGSGAQGSFRTAPWPFLLDQQLQSGGCGFYMFDPPPTCETICESPLVCGFGDQCRPMPDNVDVGKVTISGTNPEIVMLPNEYATYYTTENYPALFEPGAELTLSAEGQGNIGEFTMTALGIEPLENPLDLFVMTQGQPFTMKWTPGKNSPASAKMMIHLDIDHHAAQAAYVECIVPDSAGEVTISAELVDALIAAGHSGIGTYVENAYMTRLTREGKPVNGEICAEFQVESMVFIGVETQLKDNGK